MISYVNMYSFAIFLPFRLVFGGQDGKIDFEELRNYLHPPSGNENTAPRMTRMGDPILGVCQQKRPGFPLGDGFIESKKTSNAKVGG